MRLKTASLIGWISPTGQSVGFKLPIFANEENSNTLLVQLVDHLGKVVGFSQFDTAQEIEQSDVEYSVSEGEPAFWCFGLEKRHLVGTKDDIVSMIVSNSVKIDDIPYVEMQIVNSFGLDEMVSRAQTSVYYKIIDDIDLHAGWNWLDTEVFTPALRALLFQMLKINRSQSLIYSLMMEVVCLTEREMKIVLPNWAIQHIKRRSGWKQALVQQMQGVTSKFDIATSRDIIFKNSSFDPIKNLMSVNVDMLKDQAVKSFSVANRIILGRVSKSYFQNESGSIRVVCTFSSRYENRGKRKYWYGYHAIWDEWLGESADAYLILGCIGTKKAFALPSSLMRRIVPHLRSTGEGKDKYWHLDIIDTPNERNLLDQTKEMLPLSLKRYEFEF